jgi:hypothetical protein
LYILEHVDPLSGKLVVSPKGKMRLFLALSQPQCYTTCPNPSIGDGIKEHGKPDDLKTVTYHSEPFVTDKSEGE